MSKRVRSQYTLEFKQEAVRLVQGGQRLAMAARSLGIAEQMEIARLRKELAEARMERDILKTATAYFARELR